MARPARPWFRLYVETVFDLKLRRQPADVRWAWVAVLASARQSPRPGWLYVADRIPMTADDLAEVAAVSPEVTERAIAVFDEADMLEEVEGVWHVVNWEKRQFESDSRSGGGSTEEPAPEPESSDNGTTTEPPPLEDRGQKTENPPPSTDLIEGFNDFWRIYPARDGKKLEKRKAEDQWKRMSKAKRNAALVGVANYAASGQRPKDAFRWLRDECWEDWQTPAEPDRPKQREPEQVLR